MRVPGISNKPWRNRFEREALIRCLRLVTSAAALEELQSTLSPKMDWGYLLQAAIDQGVFPSLYRRLAETCPEPVPPEVLADWQRLYKAHARRNLKITTELIQVLNLLKSQGIIAFPYKGPVLAAVAYGDIALRQFVDLDILVSRKDMGKVKNLLLSQGYTLRYSLTKKQERKHLEYGVEVTFEHPRRTMLDVHWRLAAAYLGGGLDTEEVLQRRVSVNLEGKKVNSLAPEDMLLLLCQHGTFHLWSTLGLVSDVAHLIGSQESWDWPQLLQRAKDSGLCRQVLLGLSVANKLLSAPIPTEVLKEADADSSITTLRRQIREDMLLRGEEPQGFIEYTSFYLQILDRFKDKLKYFWIRLSIPTVEDWRWVHLPDSFYWLYYLIRPLRLGLQGLVLPLLQRFQVLLTIKANRNHH